jgi:hypothetical protein
MIPYIMGVAEIPSGFDRVKEIRKSGEGIEFVAASGKRATCAVEVDFLRA